MEQKNTEKDNVFMRECEESVYLKIRLGEPSDTPRPALLIFPGGGYEFCCNREGDPVADAFIERGYHCFVLYYSIKENAKYPRPLIDAAKAMKHIRDHAKEYNVDPDHVYACGFSAGGHLCGMLGTMWHRDEIQKEIPDMSYGYCKPTAVLLCYPVVSGFEFGHQGTIRNITGGDVSDENRAFVSIDRQIDKRSSPAFIVHTASDGLVPIENAFLAMNAYRKAGVPFEAHIFPFGPHGMALGNEITSDGNNSLVDASFAKWVMLADEFMRRF